MAVSASGYMSVIIDFAGLVAARGEADPRAHGPRLSEVSRLFNGSSERCRSDCSYAGDGHQDAASLALTGISDQLAPEVRSTGAETFPGVEKRQHDMGEIMMAGDKISNVLLEYASFSGWDDQTERLHDAADLIGKFGSHMDQPGAGRDKRAR